MVGCTEAVAEPIFLESGKSGSSADGGRGGRAGRGNSSGIGGAAGAGSGAGAGAGGKDSVATCAPGWPKYEDWPEELAHDDHLVETSLNELIHDGGRCQGVTFDRDQFVVDEDLECWSRRHAHYDLYMQNVGRPPTDLQGAINNWPMYQLTAKVMDGPGRPGGRPAETMADVGYDALLGDPENCGKLQSSSYRRLGVGHEAYIWYITLGK